MTNAGYDAFRRATGRPMSCYRQQPAFARADQPVVAVSWFDAVAYCQWLSQQTGRRFRLPTEAEWERAARGGLEGKLYPWGNQPLFERHNYHSRWREGPEPVGTSLPNGYGLHDMCENVHEWCADWYDPGYYAVSPAGNPRGPERGHRRASRGGVVVVPVSRTMPERTNLLKPVSSQLQSIARFENLQRRNAPALHHDLADSNPFIRTRHVNSRIDRPG